jgi:MYXO-CTERM domain-containing protein
MDLGADAPYEGELSVDLQKSAYSISLPDLLVPPLVVDFGAVPVGSTSEAMVKLTNAGGLTAKATVTSSDPAVFQTAAQIEVPADQEAQLVVHFVPPQAGPFKGTITVTSNSPNAPTQTFDVKGAATSDGAGGSAGAAGASGEGGAAGKAGGAAGAAGSAAGGVAGAAGSAAGAAGGVAGQGPAGSSAAGASGSGLAGAAGAADAAVSPASEDSSGGCGCRVAGPGGSSSGFALAVGLLGLALRRRRA